MNKFLITPRAYNKKLGPIMVTTSARSSCPDACPLSRKATGSLKGACYAEQGFIGAYMWANLDRVPLGGTFKRGQIKVHSFGELLAVVQDLPDGRCGGTIKPVILQAMMASPSIARSFVG